MTFKEYQSHAQRTCAHLDNGEKDGIHMIAGIFTEFGELVDAYKKTFAYGKPLDAVNIAEELADICWYAVNYASFQGLVVNPKHNHQDNIESMDAWGEYTPINAAAIAMIVLTEFLNDTGDINIDPLLEFLITFANWAGVDIYTALDNNIAKLKVRYPEKFDGDKALTRDLKTERAALERA